MQQYQTQPRRTFVASLAGGVLASLGLSRWTFHRCGGHAPSPGPHPEPRPDVDASLVLTADELGNVPYLVELYDGIREIPQIADGIRCMCGCADIEGFRSLLTCFETNGMAIGCQGCQSEGAMVVRLHKAGRTLDQLRAAVDARFG